MKSPLLGQDGIASLVDGVFHEAAHSSGAHSSGGGESAISSLEARAMLKSTMADDYLSFLRLTSPRTPEEDRAFQAGSGRLAILTTWPVSFPPLAN